MMVEVDIIQMTTAFFSKLAAIIIISVGKHSKSSEADTTKHFDSDLDPTLHFDPEPDPNFEETTTVSFNYKLWGTKKRLLCSQRAECSALGRESIYWQNLARRVI